MLASFLHLLLALSYQALPADAGRTNIILIDICSARADHIGAYGYPRKVTPEIDGLAKQAGLFENAVAQSSWCLPNAASLFTGHRPEVHGLYSNGGQGLPEMEVTLAERLRKSGYATAAFSGGVYMAPEWGLSRGFDTYVNVFSTSAPARAPAPVEDNLESITAWLREERPKGAPFFLYAAVDDLHTPYHSPEPDKYDPGYEGIAHDTETLSVPFARAYSGEGEGYPDGMLERVKEFKKDPRNLKHLIAHYDAALNHVDGQIGELLRRLKKLGLDKNTVVVVTGDHGEMLGEKGLLGHTQGLYEPVLRVPLLVRHPAIPGLAGRRFKQQIQRVDLMPTLLDMAGIECGAFGLQGKSFLPLLSDSNHRWDEFAYAGSRRNLAKPEPGRALDERVIRTQRWKLHHYRYRESFELYDLAADPLETRDISKDRPDVVSRLSFNLLRHVETVRPHAPGRPDDAMDQWQIRVLSPKD